MTPASVRTSSGTSIDPHTVPLDRIDVSDPQLYRDDSWRPLFARLRHEDPVHWCPESAYGPYWSVTRYKDIMQVEVNHTVFSSAAELGGIQVEDQPKDMDRPSFIRMDPPGHTKQRKVVAPIVAPRYLAEMEKAIRTRTCRVLDDLPRGETFDWVDRVSIELTTMMLAALFDFPWEDRRKLTWWSDVATANVNAPDAIVRSEPERFEELARMAAYMGRLYEERAKAEPKFDLLSMLAHGQATRDMPLREFMGTLALLIVGGNDTTRNSMTGGLIALKENPPEYEKLCANPALVAGFVQETIRWQTPVIHMRRTARTDTELGGKTIRAGDKVVMWYVSGNRDERAIENPEAFVIDRAKPRLHVSFGAGVHRCVGDRIAELQLRILWEEILARDLDIEIVGPPERLYSNFLRGYRALPVRIAA
ncbi:MAG: cytochrome P450 [Alphaproteobacteria bacterium]